MSIMVSFSQYVIEISLLGLPVMAERGGELW